MLIVEANALTLMHGGRTIVRGASFALGDGAKVGLIGPSGCGKSTLLRLLAGEGKPDGGALTFRRDTRVAYLPQEQDVSRGRTALDEALAGDPGVAEIQQALDACTSLLRDEALLADAARFDDLIAEQARLLDELDSRGGHALENRAIGLLRGLGLEEEAWRRPLGELSGGQRKIAGIARCLVGQPAILLLDEPDNHLDMARKRMLEQVLREAACAVLVVSHDRYLLDECVTTILELEPGREGATLRTWEGNYSAYAAQRELGLLRQQKDYVAQQKEIARLEAAVVRFKEWARVVVDERHIKQARNKQRQIDSMEKVDRPVLERRKMALQFRTSERGGQKVIELRDASKAFDGRPVVDRARATITQGERVGVVGPNGSGKTVLLKLMAGEHPPGEGEVWVGPSIRTGYYSQGHETLDAAQTPIEALRAVKPMFEADATAALTRFLLPFEALHRPIATLSGGEKSRVQLARLMQLGANCLLLDEPTNNLDIAAAEVLESALEAFSGAVVVVSHDRYLLDRLADRVLEVKDGRVRSFDGGYSAYEAASQAPPPAPALAPAAKATTPGPKPAQSPNRRRSG